MPVPWKSTDDSHLGDLLDIWWKMNQSTHSARRPFTLIPHQDLLVIMVIVIVVLLLVFHPGSRHLPPVSWAVIRDDL